MTRQQRDMAQALAHVQAAHAEAPSPGAVRTYGNLCHTFPILVRTNGLMQTLAFFGQKSGEQRGQSWAYGRLLADVAEVLLTDVAGGLIDRRDAVVMRDRVMNMTNTEYIHATRRLLGAWIYYKRLAVSLLDVQLGADEPEVD